MSESKLLACLLGALAVVIAIVVLFSCASYQDGFCHGQLEAAKGNQMYELKPTFVEKGK